MSVKTSCGHIVEWNHFITAIRKRKHPCGANGLEMVVLCKECFMKDKQAGLIPTTEEECEEWEKTGKVCCGVC